MAVNESTVVACPSCGTKNRVPAASKGRAQCASCHAPLPWITAAGDNNLHAVVDDASVPVLLDLWAPWCGPCRMVSPALESLAHEFAGRIKLVKVNVDEAPNAAQRFQAQSIPTLLVMDHGRVVSRQVGAAPEQALRTWLDGALRQIQPST
jgi:thioredoxin 2